MQDRAGEVDEFKGLRVLVVEDEAAISMLLEEMLFDFGCEVAGLAVRVSEAMKAIKSDKPDMAILDVNLAGEAVYPVADALRKRGVPFVFSTGYGRGGLPESYREFPVLQKPFMQNDLQAQMRIALAGVMRDKD